MTNKITEHILPLLIFPCRTACGSFFSMAVAHILKNERLNLKMRYIGSVLLAFYMFYYLQNIPTYYIRKIQNMNIDILTLYVFRKTL